LLGREVETLVNEKINAGTYEVDWNARGYPSGVYFYRLTSDGYNSTKEMSLVKSGVYFYRLSARDYKETKSMVLTK